MIQEKLLCAIGHLDEDILAESEQAITIRPRNAVWKIVILAAVISLSVFTSAAAAIRFLDLVNSKPVASEEEIAYFIYSVDENGVLQHVVESGSTFGIQITADLNTNSAAPVQLETVYMLTGPRGWESCGPCPIYSSGQLSQFHIRWEIPSADRGSLLYRDTDDRRLVEDFIMFSQTSAAFYNATSPVLREIDTLLGVPERAGVTSEVVTLGGISVLKVHIPVFTLTPEEMEVTWDAYMEAGEYRLYWTDGNSILTLRYPGWMTDEEASALLETIYVIDDFDSFAKSFASVP